MEPSYTVYPPFVFYNILIGLVLALGLGWVAIRLTRRFGPMDVPGSLPHKMHSVPTPLAGGITLVAVLLLGGLCFNLPMVRQLAGILLPALIIFAVGLWDDFKRLPAWIKFLGQALATLLLVLLGTYVQIIPAGFLGLPGKVHLVINLLVTILWVVGVTNAFNFIDSMDGIVVGIAGIALAFLILVTINTSQTTLLRLITLLLGACIGLFFHNMTPPRLFLGNSGAQTLGFLLAVIGILYTPVELPQAVSWFLPILVLGVPIFDTCLVVFSRLRRREPVYHAGRNHTYHRLIALGWSSNHAVAVMHITSIVLGCLAFIALNLDPLGANLLFGLTCLAGVGTFIYFERKAR